MKTLGNILWHFPFLGFISATIVYLFGLLFTATVIAAPVGLGLMEFGKFLFAPFGHAMVSKSDLKIEQNKAWKTYSTIVMILYFPLGLFFAIVGILQVIGLCISIVGIPVALVIAKSLGTYLNPVNKKCVSSAVAAELERRKGQAEVEKYLDPDDDKKQVQSVPTERLTSITTNGRTTPSWLIPAVAGGVILVLLAGGINYYQKTKREAGLLAQQRLAAEQERSRQKEKEVQRFAVQNVQQSELEKYIGTWTDIDKNLLVEITYTGNSIRIRESYDPTAGTEFFGKYSGGRIIAVGDPKDFYKFQLPEFKLLENGELLHVCGACSPENKLKKTAKEMPKVKYSPPVNGD